MKPLPPALKKLMSNPAGTLLWASVLLMIYQAALPAGLTLSPDAHILVWNLIPSDTFHVSRFDIIGNVVPYCIFANFIFVAAWNKRYSAEKMIFFTFFGTIAMVCVVEGIEYFNLHRQTAAWDVLSGAIGGFIGLFTGAAYVKVVQQPLKEFMTRNIARDPFLVAAAILIMAIGWDAARPFYIISDFGYLKSNIKNSVVIPFEPPGRDLRDQLNLRPAPPSPPERTKDYWGACAERLITYSLLLGLLIFRKRPSQWLIFLPAWFGAMVCAELISLCVVSGRADITHLCVGLMGIPIAFCGVRLASAKPATGLYMLLFTSIVFILITDLRPFRFGPPSTLNYRMFIPLIHHVESVDIMMLANIVESMFAFFPVGLLIYLVQIRKQKRETASNWPTVLWPCLVSGGLALLMETLQIWCVERTPGIEDVIYAMLGGYAGASAAQIYLHHTHTPRDKT